MEDDFLDVTSLKAESKKMPMIIIFLLSGGMTCDLPQRSKHLGFYFTLVI